MSIGSSTKNILLLIGLAMNSLMVELVWVARQIRIQSVETILNWESALGNLRLCLHRTY